MKITELTLSNGEIRRFLVQSEYQGRKILLHEGFIPDTPVFLRRGKEYARYSIYDHAWLLECMSPEPDGIR